MAAGPFEADLAMPFGVAARGAAASRQLVSVLRVGDTSWVAPRTSRYTIYAYGCAGSVKAGGFVRLTKVIGKGSAFTSKVGVGLIAVNNTQQSNASTDTTFTGPGVAITAAKDGGVCSGGDINIPGTTTQSGGDGSVFGPFSLTKTVSGDAAETYTIGQHPGGWVNPNAATNFARGGDGEIRIVDETP